MENYKHPEPKVGSVKNYLKFMGKMAWFGINIWTGIVAQFGILAVAMRGSPSWILWAYLAHVFVFLNMAYFTPWVMERLE